MAHLLRSVLYPNGEYPHQQHRSAHVASSSSSNPGPRRRQTSDPASFGAGDPMLQPNQGPYNNPPAFFSQNPEIEEPAQSGFVANNIFGGFDLNNEPNDNTHAVEEPAAAENFVPRPGSATSGNASNAAEENAEEISSQPVVPYVGMIFDDLEVAKEVYNQYAFKMGFGIHISNTKYRQARGAPKDTPLSRVFACVHSGKPIVEAQRSGKNVTGVAAKGLDSTVDMSSSSAQKSKGEQAVEQMDVRDSRQRNKHIVRVMVHLNVKQIPDRYMLPRWSQAATTPAPDPGTSGVRFGVPATNTLKYNSLCRKMNDLASDACISNDTYAMVSDMIAEAKKVVATMHRERIARVKPKGCPSEKEKRRKPLIELRDEANKKRQKMAEEPNKKKEPKPKRKARVKKCRFCNEEGHVVNECFVADIIFGGFDLNNEPNDNTHAAEEPAAAENFVPRPGSATSGNASNAAEENAEEISSQPVVPYVGMIFDDLEVAKEVYNQYAFKMGFGIHISNTKYRQARGAPKDTPLSRVFACVHSGKPIVEAQRSGKNVTGVAAKGLDSTLDMSSSSAHKSKGKQAVEQMDVRDSRQRNKVLRLDCKACMLVGIRNSSWTVTVFEATHTYRMVSQARRRRYYRSHRKVP
ncbi:hypothetical protein ACQ4PT_023222 [Festuca glaucescens]